MAMKRVFCLMMFVSILLAGCSPEVNTSATQTADAFTGAVKAVVQTQQAGSKPSPTPVPPTAAPAVTANAASNTGGPAGPVGPVIFDDKFDQLSSDWETVWLTPHIEKTSKSVIRSDDGWLLFDFKEKNALAYAFNKNVSEADVVIDTVNQIGGPGQTEVAVACRAKSDLSGWIDFRILYMYEYAIYKYDKSLANLGKNPFIKLARGHISRDLLKPGEFNSIRATCKGKTLSLDLNNTRLGSVDVNNDMLSPGLVGVGGMGPDGASASVFFDYVTVSKP
jgi:hypothetical protein